MSGDPDADPMDEGNGHAPPTVAGAASGGGSRAEQQHSRPASPQDEAQERGVREESDRRGGRRGEEDDHRRRRASRDASRDNDRERDRDRSRSRDRSRRERKDRHRSRTRSRSRERHRSSRHRSRSRSRDRHRRRSRTRSRSRERRRSSRRSPTTAEEYGGYRPRKRQDDAKPVPAAGINNAYYDPFYHLRQQNKIQNPQEALRLWQEQQLQARLMVLQQQAASAMAAASKTQRELYIGNLAAGHVSEDALRQVFESALKAAFPECTAPGQEPVVNMNLHTDGRYCFIEFRKPEYATAALALNGQVQLMGQAISVGRPAAYVDPTKAQAAAEQAAHVLAQFRAGNTDVLTAAGVPAAPGLPPPSAADQATAQAAMARTAAAAAGAAGGDAAAAAPSTAATAAAPAVAAAAPVVPPPAADARTAYLAVTGVVGVEAFADDVEYEETIEDLREESQKVGELVGVHIPRPADRSKSKELFGTGMYGKAFIAFGDVAAAERARARMHGRMFAGNMVTVAFIGPEEFEAAASVGKAEGSGGGGSGEDGGDATEEAAAVGDAAGGEAADMEVADAGQAPAPEGVDERPAPEGVDE